MGAPLAATPMTVRGQFASYMQACGFDLATMPSVQLVELRRAFYAGFTAALSVLTDLPDDASDQQHEAQVGALMAELIVFKETVGTPLEGTL